MGQNKEKLGFVIPSILGAGTGVTMCGLGLFGWQVGITGVGIIVSALIWRTILIKRGG